MTETILLAATFLLSSFVMGFAGFGFGMVAVPLLSAFMSPKLAVPFATLFSWVINTLSLIKYRRSIERKMVRHLIFGTLIGIPLGVAFLKYFDDFFLKKILGTLTILFSLSSLLPLRGPKIRVTDRYAYPLGLLSGFLSGGFGSGGLPALVFVAAKNLDKEKWKGTLHWVWLFNLSSMVLFLAAFGMLDGTTLRGCLTYTPWVLLGLVGGYWLFDRLDPILFRRIVMGGLLAIGIKLLF